MRRLLLTEVVSIRSKALGLAHVMRVNESEVRARMAGGVRAIRDALRWLDEVILHADLSQEVLKRLHLDGLLAMRCSCSEARKLADRVFSIADAKERKSKGAWNAFSDAVEVGDVFFVEVGFRQGAGVE